MDAKIRQALAHYAKSGAKVPDVISVGSNGEVARKSKGALRRLQGWVNDGGDQTLVRVADAVAKGLATASDKRFKKWAMAVAEVRAAARVGRGAPAAAADGGAAAV